MQTSLSWLKELVDYNLSTDELADKLSLTSIGVKQQTEDYLELDLTYNRGDLLSLRGVAYEVSAITNSPLKFLAQVKEDFIWVEQNLPEVKVIVEDKNLCPIYCVAKIEGLKVEPSTKDRVKKLADCNMRPVNNVADVTNLIMLEYGQPMHAFDARGVKNEEIIVRTAKKGERITTLDGKTRDLENSDLLIADSQNALGIAGVMGGKDCEVSDTTSTILLEAAIFDPISIRNTSKKHGLYSEAGKRFQHGLSKIRLLQALDGAIRMYQGLGGKLTAITLVGDFEITDKKLNLRISKVNSLLGITLDEQTITGCLTKLNFTVSKKDADTLEVISPYFRLDIQIEEDLIEEVARIYGYEKIEGIPLDGGKPDKLDQTLQNFIHNLKLSLKEAELTEVQTYSFYSTQVISNFQFPISNLVKIANPISSETEYLRDQNWPNLVETVVKNIRQGYKDIAISEIGKIYQPGPKESYRLSIALMNGSNYPIEELHAMMQALAVKFKLEIHFGNEKMTDTDKKLFHPTRFYNLSLYGKVNDGEHVGYLAEVHPKIVNKFGIENRVAILEIDIENLLYPIVS